MTVMLPHARATGHDPARGGGGLTFKIRLVVGAVLVPDAWCGVDNLLESLYPQRLVEVSFVILLTPHAAGEWGRRLQLRE